MLGNPIEKKIRWLLVILVAWAVAAYLVIPRVAKLYYRHHFTDGPRITQTANEHPGDPVNVAIEGEEELLVRAMHAAGWYPADPITFSSSVRIVVDSVVRKPDDDAPVSSLFFWTKSGPGV